MKHRLASRRSLPALALPLGFAAAGLLAPARAQAAPSLEDYKYFRSLSVDLLGRIPTRQELDEFRKPGFSIDKWMDEHLKGDDYADRLTRVYADLLHLDINTFRYENRLASLNRIQVLDENGKLIWVYFRHQQKRPQARPNNDAAKPLADFRNGGLCFFPAEVGYTYGGGNLAPQMNYPPSLATQRISKALLDSRTSVVRPWWLYDDYKSATPTSRFNATTWAAKHPGFVLANALNKDLDGTDAVEIRVCKQEANTADMGTDDTTKMPISCLGSYGGLRSSTCGCGPGMEWCFPGSGHSFQNPGAAFRSSKNVLLGTDEPTDLVDFSHLDWLSLWMSQEARQFIFNLFAEDRDFREILTGRHTFVNGPLAQFYYHPARSNWRDFSTGYTNPVPVVDPAALPKDLTPYDAMAWRRVADRGATAAGVLTMPVFQMKYATRRARAHQLYNTFLCRDFVSPPGLQLTTSTDPDLTKRDGCAACHGTLEPLAAYFARNAESDWTYLDAKSFPAVNKACTGAASDPAACRTRYDAVFKTAAGYPLRGAYASTENTEAGAVGLAKSLVAKPEFADCVVQNVATSFLGRELHAEDAALRAQMTDALVKGGFRVKPMIKALLTSTAYRSANNLASDIWRKTGGK